MDALNHVFQQLFGSSLGSAEIPVTGKSTSSTTTSTTTESNDPIEIRPTDQQALKNLLGEHYYHNETGEALGKLILDANNAGRLPTQEIYVFIGFTFPALDATYYSELQANFILRACKVTGGCIGFFHGDLTPAQPGAVVISIEFFDAFLKAYSATNPDSAAQIAPEDEQPVAPLNKETSPLSRYRVVELSIIAAGETVRGIIPTLPTQNFSTQLKYLSVLDGHQEAAYQLGLIYLEGKAVTLDRKKALDYLLNAATVDHKKALAKLACEDKTALTPLLDRPGTLYLLGVLKFEGLLMPKNIEEAKAHWRLAADDHRHKGAMYQIARAYHESMVDRNKFDSDIEQTIDDYLSRVAKFRKGEPCFVPSNNAVSSDGQLEYLLGLKYWRMSVSPSDVANQIELNEIATKLFGAATDCFKLSAKQNHVRGHEMVGDYRAGVTKLRVTTLPHSKGITYSQEILINYPAAIDSYEKAHALNSNNAALKLARVYREIYKDLCGDRYDHLSKIEKEEKIRTTIKNVITWYQNAKSRNKQVDAELAHFIKTVQIDEANLLHKIFDGINYQKIIDEAMSTTKDLAASNQVAAQPGAQTSILQPQIENVAEEDEEVYSLKGAIN